MFSHYLEPANMCLEHSMIGISKRQVSLDTELKDPAKAGACQEA
jgi:hypothetical protein